MAVRYFVVISHDVEYQSADGTPLKPTAVALLYSNKKKAIRCAHAICGTSIYDLKTQRYIYGVADHKAALPKGD